MTERERSSMIDDSIDSVANVRVAEQIADAPLPTGRTLWTRRNFVVQSWRFVRINLKMMRIIFGGHFGGRLGGHRPVEPARVR